MNKIGIAILLLLVYACSSQPETRSELEEEVHENESSQLTLYSDELELFIEYDPLQKGKKSEFLVHLTELKTYKPVTSGSLVLKYEGKSITVKNPEKPGIYHLGLTPGTPGKLEIEFILERSEVKNTLTGLFEVHDLSDVAIDEQEAVDETHAEETGEIVFLKEQAWKSDFRVDEVIRQPFSSVIHVSGEILAMPGEKKSLVSAVSGILLFEGRNLVQGMEVRKGQHLFTLSSRDLIENNAQVKIAEYRARLDQSRSEFLRYRKLIENDAVSEKKFIESQTRYAEDSIRFYSISGNLDENGYRVYSPVSGYIHELNVSDGQFVDAGFKLLTISSNKVLLLRADIPQQYLDRLGDIEAANFRTAYSDRIYTTAELNAKLISRASSVAENDHYIPLFFEVGNDGSLLEGAYAEFYLIGKEKQNKVVVATEALLEEQGSFYTYVQKTGESFTKRSVVPGDSDGRKTEILSGLNPGERIVSRGVMLVKSASMVTGVSEHGHSH